MLQHVQADPHIYAFASNFRHVRQVQPVVNARAQQVRRFMLKGETVAKKCIKSRRGSKRQKAKVRRKEASAQPAKEICRADAPLSMAPQQGQRIFSLFRNSICNPTASKPYVASCCVNDSGSGRYPSCR